MPKQTTNKATANLFSIWKQEIKAVFRDEGILLFFVIVPFLYPLLYTSLYTTEVVRDLPIAVVDNSYSSLSREYLRKIDATPEVEIVAQCTDLKTAEELMKNEEVYGIVYIPNDFSKKIHNATEQAHVSVFSNMASFFYYSAILSANTEVSLAMNDEIKLQHANGTARQEELQIAPIEYEHITLFNSQNGFAASIIPAVLILIIHQLLLLGIGLRTGTEREQKVFRNLVAQDKSYTGTLRLILGRALAYFMIYLLNCAYILFFVPALFGLPHIGHLFDILAFIIPFLTATIFFAMTFSIFARNRETIIILFVFTSIPMLFLSGISFPSYAISPIWKSISYLLPSTLGVNAFVRLNTMGAHLPQIKLEYIGLWLQVALYFCTTFFIYRRELTRK